MAQIREIQFQKFVGDDPANGIAFALMPDASAKNVLGYDPASGVATLPARVTASPAAANAPVIAVTAINPSSGASAQAIVAVATATVVGYVVAVNAAGSQGVHLVAQSAHALYFSTASTQRMKILTTGEVIVGSSDVGGTELLRVLAGVRAGGKLLSGAATSIAEVASASVGSRQTFYGGAAGGPWQMRWAYQAAYGAAPTDLIALTDAGALVPAAAGAGSLGSAAARWGGVWANAVRVGPAVVAPGRTDAVQLFGDFYMEGLLGVVVNSVNALVVAHPTGLAVHARVDTTNGAAFFYKNLFVSAAGSTTAALLAVDHALGRVAVGLGLAANAATLVVNGSVSAQQKYLLDGLDFADRLVAGWTRFRAQDGHDVLTYSNTALGSQFYVQTDLLTVISPAGGNPLLLLDLSSNAGQLGLSVNHAGVLKRVMVGGANTGGAGLRLLTIAN